jgi:hypothetical protein
MSLAIISTMRADLERVEEAELLRLDGIVCFEHQRRADRRHAAGNRSHQRAS